MHYFRLRNWDRYQHYKDRAPPWIKLHFEILSSQDWVMLSDQSKLLAIACMLIASRHNGKIPDSPEYVKRVAYLDHMPNFKPLIDSGFLEIMIADDINCKQEQANDTPEERRGETEKRREEKRRGETEVGPMGSPNRASSRSKKMTDDEFLENLKKNPAYSHIDIDFELGKMDGWLSARPDRQKTRRFITGWLNKIDKPLGETKNGKPKYRNPSLEAIDEWATENGIGDEVQTGSSDFGDTVPRAS